MAKRLLCNLLILMIPRTLKIVVVVEEDEVAWIEDVAVHEEEDVVTSEVTVVEVEVILEVN